MGQKRRIKISTLTGVTFTVTLPNGRSSIVDLKKELPFPPEGQVLVYKGKSLADSMTLDQLGFEGGERCILFYDKKQASAARVSPSSPPESETPPPTAPPRETPRLTLQPKDRRPQLSLNLKRLHPNDSGSDVDSAGDWNLLEFESEPGSRVRRPPPNVRTRTASSRPRGVSLDSLIRPSLLPDLPLPDFAEPRRALPTPGTKLMPRKQKMT